MAAQHVYTQFARETISVRIDLLENGQPVGQMAAPLMLRAPQVGLQLSTDSATAGITTTLALTATLSGELAALNEIEWRITGDNGFNQSALTPLASAGTYSQTTFSLNLPPAFADENYFAAVALPGTSQALLTQQIPVKVQGSLNRAEWLALPTVGAINTDTLRLTFNPVSAPAAVVAQARLWIAGIPSGFSSPLEGAALGAAPTNLLLNTPLPVVLNRRLSYRVEISATVTLSTSGFTFQQREFLPIKLADPAPLQFTDTTLLPGDAFSITLPLQIGGARLPQNSIFSLSALNRITRTTEPLSINQTELLPDGRVRLYSAMPDDTTPAPYYVQISNNALSGWTGQVSTLIPGMFLTHNVAEQANAGQTLTWQIVNDGLRDEILTGTLALYDGYGSLMAQTDFAGTPLPEGQSIALNLLVPGQAAMGDYYLNLSAQDQLGLRENQNRVVALNGQAALLQSQSDQPVYLSNQTVNLLSTITPTLPINDALLRLQIYSLRSDITGTITGTGWLARYADSGNTAAVSFDVDNFFNHLPPFNNVFLAPLTVGDLTLYVTVQIDPDTIGAQSTSYTLHATTHTGFALWQQPLNGQPIALATNGSFVYVLDFNQISAYNLSNPAIQWAYTDPDGQAIYDMLVNEHAVIAQHNFPPARAGVNATIPGYTLLNPATGVPFGEVESDGNALLNGTRLYFTKFGGENLTLRAFDILQNNLLWSEIVPFPFDLLAANEQFVVGIAQSPHDTRSPQPSFDFSYYLWSFHPDSGFLNSISIGSSELTPGFYTLQGDNFFFVQQLFDSGGNTTKIYRLNLSTNNLTELTQASGTLQGLIAVGQGLYAINQDDQTLTKFNAADGAFNSTSSLEECTTSAEIVPWAPNLLNEDLGGVHLYDPFNQIICPRSVAQGGRAAQPTALTQLTLLREEFVPVNGSSQIDLNTPLTAPNLLDDPRARGLLFVRATLFGAEPIAASPTARQILAEDASSFFVEETSGAAVLLTNAQTYRRNQSGYPADDADSVVHLRGVLRNTSSLASDITLTLTRGGQTLFTQTFTNVAAGDERSFDFEDTAPPVGIHLYEAFNSLGGSAGAEVEILAPQVAAALSAAPSLLYLGDAAQAQTVLTNNGSTPAFVTADANGSSQNVRILAGQTLTLTQIVTPSQSGAFNLTFTLTGDVTQTQTFALAVIDETAISGSIDLFGAVRDANTLLQDPAAGLEISLSHAQPITLSVQALVQIQGAGFFSETQSLPLPQGTTAFTVTPGILPLGAYSVDVQIFSARNGALLTEFNRTFEIAAPQTLLTLALQDGTPAPDGTQPVTITVANLPAADLAWEGQLTLEGLLSEGITVTLNPGNALTFTRSVNLLNFAGSQPITATLRNSQNGALLTQTLTLNGAPRNAPAVTLLEAAQVGSAAAAGELNLRVRLNNLGPAGEVLLSVDAFDTTLNPQAAAPSRESEIFFQIPIPAGLLAGRYPVTVRLNQQVIRFDAVLSGNQLEVSAAFDAENYPPFSPFVWTVNLLASGGSPAQYDVFIRYRGEEQMQTLTLNPGQSAPVSAAFVTPQVSNDLITLIVTNHPVAGQARYNLLIYADRVPTRADDGVWLQTDKAIYDAGETVNLTVHLDRPTLFAAVMAPEDIPDGGAPLLWSSLQISPTVPITVSAVVTGSDGVTRTSTITLTQHIMGEFAFDYTLPETMRSGRYAFKLLFDSQERLVPIDVNGVTMVVETLDVVPIGVAQRTPLGAAQAFTLQAQVRSSVTVNNARVLAYAVDGAGRYYELGVGASITQTLQAGLNNIQLSGTLQAAAPGAYSIVFKVYNQSLQAELASELSVLEVGSAMLHSLTTSSGVYAPGEPGLGTLTVFGTGSAQLRVTTSDGTPLLAQSDSLNGFREYTFTLPTAVALDEVLIATLTDTLGLTSSLQTAYKVAAEFDITAPEIALLTPADGALLTVPTNPARVTVSGIVTDTGGVAQVYLTQGFSQTQATVQPDGTWQAEMDFALGYNTFQVVAFDAAGNPAVDVFGVFVEPQYGITVNATPTTAPAGSLLTFSSVITSSIETTITVQFPFANAGIQAISGSAAGGELTLGSAPTWVGRVSPNAPVTITWIGQANQVIETQVQAHAQTEGTSLRLSAPVVLTITTAEPPLNKIYLPLIFRNFSPYYGYP